MNAWRKRIGSMIDWESQESHVLLNPRLPREEQEIFSQVLAAKGDFPGHIWLTSSGTSGRIKLVGLSKQALLASAQAVNKHLLSGSNDVWLNPLPLFHVGGLGILARAHLSGARMIALDAGKWHPQTFFASLTQRSATLTSLVPSQVYDLTAAKLQAPAHLRAVIVGGGALAPSLYEEAKKLGWPLLPSYGMTECASQIATAKQLSPELHLLSHVKMKTTERGTLSIQSPALLTAYACFSNGPMTFVDPKRDGWFETEDLGVFEKGFLQLFGRGEETIKIGGETVSMVRLQNILEEAKLHRCYRGELALIAFPDERLGHVIHLAVEDETQVNLQLLLDAYHAKVLPFEKVRRIHAVSSIPRTPLGKVIRPQLMALLSTSPENGTG